MGIFDDCEAREWPYRWHAKIHLVDIAGGTPANKEALEWHLTNRLSENATDVEITALAAEIMAEQEMSEEQALDSAIAQYVKERGMTRFRRDPERGLFIMDYQIKACIVEAGMGAVNSGSIKSRKWGTTNKGFRGWALEHINVIERHIYLGTNEGEVHTSFPAVRDGSRAIKYTEVCEDVGIAFTVEADAPLDRKFWGAIWTRAQRNGLGADRKHYGQFEVVAWDTVLVEKGSRQRPAAA